MPRGQQQQQLRRVQALCQHLTAGNAPKLLKGIKVVELATVVMSPACAAIFADLGAEVVKVEPPNGDGWRATNAGYKGGDTFGCSFEMANRGKKSVVLDLKQGEHLAAFKQLLGQADVFITNMRLTALKRLKIDYETIADDFPSLIYAHGTGFGTGGSWSDKPGYDIASFYAATGMFDMFKSNDEAELPRYPGASGDHCTSMALYGAIMTALFHRQRTGKGQKVEASLYHSGLWAMALPITQHGAGVAPGGPRSTRKDITMPTLNRFRCKDGTWVQLINASQKAGKQGLVGKMTDFFSALGVMAEAQALYGPGNWADWQQRYNDGAGVISTEDRLAFAAPLNEICERAFLRRTFDEWAPILEKNDIWYQTVLGYESVLDDPEQHEHSRSIGALVDPESWGGEHHLVAAPMQFSVGAQLPRARAPELGEHTAEVLQRAGIELPKPTAK